MCCIQTEWLVIVDVVVCVYVCAVENEIYIFMFPVCIHMHLLLVFIAHLMDAINIYSFSCLSLSLGW